VRSTALARRDHPALGKSWPACVLLMASVGLLLAEPVAAAGAQGGVAPVARDTKSPGTETADITRSADAARLLKWVTATGDNLDLPFIIIDKVHANATAFHPDGSPVATAAALIGLGRGDVSPPGIGQRRLADIPPADRITPAGRFIASLGNDLGVADVLWVDYDAGISLHRVITGNPKDNRRMRLASTTTTDNRISYGCINVPVAFFESVIHPLFARTNGVVYILPEAKPLSEIFDLPASGGHGNVGATEATGPTNGAGPRSPNGNNLQHNP